MRTRIQLNPLALRHYRDARGWTQKQAAECLRKKVAQIQEHLVRVYQRIERTGVTSPASAEKLAKHLGTTVDDLQMDAPEGEDVFGPFWVDMSDPTIENGELLPGGLAAYSKLRERLMGHDHAVAFLDLKATGEIDDCGKRTWDANALSVRARSRITVSIKGVPYGFNIESRTQKSTGPYILGSYRLISAARYEHGVRWTKMNSCQRKWIAERLTLIGHYSADTVEIDDRIIPPVQSPVHVKVRFAAGGEMSGAPVFTGESVFPSLESTLWSAYFYIGESGRRPVEIITGNPILLVFSDDQPFRMAAVNLVWCKEDRTLEHAPWRDSWNRRFKELIESVDQIPIACVPPRNTVPSFYMPGTCSDE